MYLDSLNYLPDDIMVKVDRASMAVSLETRAPMLDHRVAELAWRLPFDAKVRGSVTKWVLREIVYRHVPRELVDRPKSGFAVPLADWIRGPLREWARALTEPRVWPGRAISIRSSSTAFTIGWRPGSSTVCISSGSCSCFRLGWVDQSADSTSCTLTAPSHPLILDLASAPVR